MINAASEAFVMLNIVAAGRDRKKVEKIFDINPKNN